jgi:hypothetical protein
MSVADVPHEAKLWEATANKLRGHLMPPPGKKQPSAADNDDLIDWLQTSLDNHDQTPRAGYTPVQRLNRTEYANVASCGRDQVRCCPEMDGRLATSLCADRLAVLLDQYIGCAIIAKQAVGRAPRAGRRPPAAARMPSTSRVSRCARRWLRSTISTDAEYRLNSTTRRGLTPSSEISDRGGFPRRPGNLPR